MPTITSYFTMRVLFFTNYFYPHIGGVEKHVFELSKELVQNGHSVSVITQRFDKKLPGFEKYNKIKVHRIEAGKLDWFQKIRIWRSLFEHLDLIRNAEVIHIHDVFFWYLPFRFLFFWKKVYVTFHGYESYPVPFKNIVARRITEFLSDGNICIGDFMKEWYFSSPTFISYGGVSIPQISNTASSSNYSALFYGRLDDQTGIREYLRAVKLIRKKVPKFRFKVIGDGKYKSLIRDKDFQGFKLHPEKELKRVRFAFLSRYLSILEALAARRLVFALFDNEIKEDYLRMSPFEEFVIVVGSPEELYERLLYFMKNPNKERQLVEKGYRFAKKNTWKKVADTYQALWRKRQTARVVVIRTIMLPLIASATFLIGVFLNSTLII